MTQVTIRYCVVCMLRTRAERVAELLREQLGVETILEHGGFGEFSILLDGDVVSRRTTIAKQSDDSIVEAVRSRLIRQSTNAGS